MIARQLYILALYQLAIIYRTFLLLSLERYQLEDVPRHVLTPALYVHLLVCKFIATRTSTAWTGPASLPLTSWVFPQLSFLVCSPSRYTHSDVIRLECLGTSRGQAFLVSEAKLTQIHDAIGRPKDP